MNRLTGFMVAAAFAGALVSGPARAQLMDPRPPAPIQAQSGSTKASESRATERKAPKRAAKKPAEPTMWDKTKSMTRAQWNSAKKSWAQQKDKWNSCNAQARKDKLSGSKRWSFIGSCMTG